MKSKIEIHRIPYGTEEWHKYRMNGIGGSEVGSVLRLNPYESSVRVYHEKVGTQERQRDDTEFMFWGREEEDKIAEVWQYHDGTETGYIQNHRDGKIIRKCKNINGYAVNPDYPWLFASVDRLINKDGGVNFLTGKPLEEEAVLVCKLLSHWAAQAWETGMPIYFITQV